MARRGRGLARGERGGVDRDLGAAGHGRDGQRLTGVQHARDQTHGVARGFERVAVARVQAERGLFVEHHAERVLAHLTGHLAGEPKHDVREQSLALASGARGLSALARGGEAVDIGAGAGAGARGRRQDGARAHGIGEEALRDGDHAAGQRAAHAVGPCAVVTAVEGRVPDVDRRRDVGARPAAGAPVQALVVRVAEEVGAGKGGRWRKRDREREVRLASGAHGDEFFREDALHAVRERVFILEGVEPEAASLGHGR